MNNFYYAEGTSKKGPYTLEELREKNINKETLVWYNQLENWTPAGEIELLRSFFNDADIKLPPALHNSTPQPEVENIKDPFEEFRTNPKPTSWLILAILITVICCQPLGIVAIVKAAKVDKLYWLKDFDGARKASTSALRWSIISIIATFVFFFLLYAIGYTVGSLNSGSFDLNDYGEFYL